MSDLSGPDTLRLIGLQVRGRHGVLLEERHQEQLFVIDVVLALDVREAAASDDLARTVDYGALASELSDVVAHTSVDLLETLAMALAEVCLAHERVRSAQVTVHKPNAPLSVPFEDVAVTVVRP